MKEIDELNLPDDVRYSKEHEWVKLKDGSIVIGISDYAQDQMGDVVFVELPQVGDTLGTGEEFGTVESVKAVSELYMPVGGEIVSINDALEANPELVNKNPYEEGWMIEVKPNNVDEMDEMMEKAKYIKLLKGL